MEEELNYVSPLGNLYIKTVNDFLVELEFKDHPHQNSSFKKACTPVMQKTVQQLNDYFSGKNLHFTLPVKQLGTAFQQSVWKALENIKPGKTQSYLQLSKLIQNPKAVRAVGMANSKNKIAIVVPCHRVIGANGNLVGYAGQLWRKNWLLNHEAKYANGLVLLFPETGLPQKFPL